MGKTLVVFYSRTGYTSTIARAIAAACNADLEQIHDVRSRKGFWGYWRSAREALKRIPAPILPPSKDPAAYNVVVIGGPVWASHVCAPLRSYIQAQRDKFRAVALFVTYGGNGADKVLTEMAQLCGKATRGVLDVRDAEVKAATYGEKVQQFLQSIGA
jgi:flavodoxin